jgi:hypothetical protein
VRVNVPAMLLYATLAACGGDDRPKAERDAGPPPDTGVMPPRDAGPTPATPDPAMLAKAAVVARSCLGAFAGEPVGSATSLLMRIYGTVGARTALPRLMRDQAACIAAAGTGCDAIGTCLGIEFPTSPDCVPGCDRETAVFCDGGHARWRCGSVGLTCDPVSGTCVTPTACTMPACVDDRPVGCTGTVADPRDLCGDYGLACELAGGGPACTSTGEACTSGSDGFDIQWFYDPEAIESPAIECVDADTLATCVGGARHELPCATVAAGMRCRMTTDVMPRFFCGLGTSCNPFTPVGEACSGNAVPVCNAGRLDAVSCTELGFTRCMLGRCE